MLLSSYREPCMIPGPYKMNPALHINQESFRPAISITESHSSIIGRSTFAFMHPRWQYQIVHFYGCSEQTYIWASWYSIRESRVSNWDSPISSGIASTSIGTKSSYKSSVVASGTSDRFLRPPEERSEEYLLASGDDFWLRSSEILQQGIQNNLFANRILKNLKYYRKYKGFFW